MQTKVKKKRGVYVWCPARKPWTELNISWYPKMFLPHGFVLIVSL